MNTKAQQAAEEKYPIVSQEEFDSNKFTLPYYKDYVTYVAVYKDAQQAFLAGANWQSSQPDIPIGTKGKLLVDYGPITGLQKIEAELISAESKYKFKCFDIEGKPWVGLIEAPISDFIPDNKTPAALPVVDNQDIFKACEMVWQHIYKIYNLTDENTTTVMTNFILNKVLQKIKTHSQPPASVEGVVEKSYNKNEIAKQDFINSLGSPLGQSPMMNFMKERPKINVFHIDTVRDLLNQYKNKEISLSKFVEILNDKAIGIDAIERYKNASPVEGIKSAEEVLYKHTGGVYENHKKQYIAAMEEYHSQFHHPVSAGVWVLATARLPEKGKSVFCRKSYYANKSGTGKTIFTIGKPNGKGELSVIERYPANWEWLDESQSVQVTAPDGGGEEKFTKDDMLRAYNYFRYRGFPHNTNVLEFQDFLKSLNENEI